MEMFGLKIEIQKDVKIFTITKDLILFFMIIYSFDSTYKINNPEQYIRMINGEEFNLFGIAGLLVATEIVTRIVKMEKVKK